MCVHGLDGMLFFNSGKLEPLAKDSDKWVESSILVFEGDYSQPGSRVALVDTVLGLYAMTLHDTAKHKMLHGLVEKQKSRVFPAEFFEDLPDRLARVMLSDKSKEVDILSAASREMTSRGKSRKQSTTTELFFDKARV